MTANVWRLAPSSTSSSVSSSSTLRPARLPSTSASVKADDQRTLPNGRHLSGRLMPTSQNPPSTDGPNTTSARRNAAKAAAISCERTCGASLPITTTGPRGMARITRASRPPDRRCPAPPGCKGLSNTRPVRRNRHPAAPPCVLAAAPFQHGDGAALKPQRADIADVGGQPPLARPQLRTAREDDKVLPAPALPAMLHRSPQ